MCGRSGVGTPTADPINSRHPLISRSIPLYYEAMNAVTNPQIRPGRPRPKGRHPAKALSVALVPHGPAGVDIVTAMGSTSSSSRAVPGVGSNAWSSAADAVPSDSAAACWSRWPRRARTAGLTGSWPAMAATRWRRHAVPRARRGFGEAAAREGCRR